MPKEQEPQRPYLGGLPNPYLREDFTVAEATAIFETARSLLIQKRQATHREKNPRPGL